MPEQTSQRKAYLKQHNREYYPGYYSENKDKIRTRSKDWYDNNKARAKESRKKWRESNRERHSRNKLIWKYGITPEEKDAIFQSQGSKCGICGSLTSSVRGWHLDHCHDTKKVRGVLCHNCNLLLGHAKDSAATLKSAYEYIIKHSTS